MVKFYLNRLNSIKLSDLNEREQVSMNLVHVVNVEIKDNHEEATLGSFVIYELVEKV